jgi:CheY-like chemotaxis protein
MRAPVVDDSTAMRLYLRHIFAVRGFEVIEAKNGHQCLGRVREITLDRLAAMGFPVAA